MTTDIKQPKLVACIKCKMAQIQSPAKLCFKCYRSKET